jgi:hypothetical protein
VQRLLKASRLDALIVEYKFPFWDRLHGFWRTIPNFNPNVVSTDPSQDLAATAERLMFTLRGTGNVSEVEDKDASPPDPDMDEELEDADARDMDIEDELEGFDDPLDEVRGSNTSSRVLLTVLNPERS